MSRSERALSKAEQKINKRERDLENEETILAGSKYNQTIARLEESGLIKFIEDFKTNYPLQLAGLEITYIPKDEKVRNKEVHTGLVVHLEWNRKKELFGETAKKCNIRLEANGSFYFGERAVGTDAAIFGKTYMLQLKGESLNNKNAMKAIAKMIAHAPTRIVHDNIYKGSTEIPPFGKY